jgi:hypothetical protein
MSGKYFCPAFSKLLVVPLLLFFSNYLYAQRSISGRVFSNAGVSLPGVTVMVKATNKSAITDSAGRFIIEANPGSFLEISSIGYQTQRIKIGNDTELVYHFRKPL